MKSNSSWRIRLAQILLGAAIVFALVAPRGTHAQGRDDRGQDLKGWDGKAPENPPVHLTTDWSHRHLVFSTPHNLGHHVHLLSNPRYVQQLVRRNSEKKGDPNAWRWRRAPENPDLLKGDWSMYLGAGGTAGPNTYPAKYSFSQTTASCSDFVVYNTSLAPSPAAVAASQFGTFTAGTPSGSVVITNNNLPGPNNAIALVSSTTSNTSLFWQTSAAPSSNAANLAAAITRQGAGIGVAASSAGAIVTVRATNTGSENNGATGITLEESVTDFTWNATSLAGGLNGASIVAFDNLYTGAPVPTCFGLPSTYWAYDTGGTIVTSPVLSYDGTQVAVVQNAGGTSQLVLIKWAASTGTVNAPVIPGAATSGANYRTCTAPCQLTITFSNSNGGSNATDSNSSPFYDYPSDVLYVGNDNGYLHKFTGVFSGTPAEVVSTAPDIWPASVNRGGVLTSPIFDEIGKIFVGSNNATLYSVDGTIGSGTGGISNSGLLGGGGAAGIDDSPLVDTTLGMVYVFERSDHSGSGGRTGVWQCTTALVCTEAVVSSNNTVPTTFYAGDFDNTYYTSANGTGSMYVCSTGLVSGNTLVELWRIPISSGALGRPAQGPQLVSAAGAAAACSPITESYNGTTDLMFMSVTGSSSICTGAAGCLTSFDITSAATWGTAVRASASVNVTGGASGVVVDGSSTAPGASQVYFTPLADQPCTTSGGIGGCAIQASQSALQ
jgi:hypothetical protein